MAAPLCLFLFPKSFMPLSSWASCCFSLSIDFFTCATSFDSFLSAPWSRKSFTLQKQISGDVSGAGLGETSVVLAQSLTGIPFTPFEWLKSVERKLNRTAMLTSGAPLTPGVQVTEKPSKEDVSSSMRVLLSSPSAGWPASTNSTAWSLPPRWWASFVPRPSFQSPQHTLGF